MNLETIEDFEKFFPDEDTCIRFLWGIREKVANYCPKCKCEKLYKNSDGKTKKCSNKLCRNNFRIKTNSFIENTKLSIKEWLTYIFLFAKTRGRFSAHSNEKHNFITAYVVDDRIKRLFHNISKEDANINYLFIEACKNIFILTVKDIVVRKSTKGLKIDPNEIIDLNDKKIYNRVLLFTSEQLHYALKHKFIFELFIEPESLIGEALLNIAESNTQVITGQVLVDALRKTQTRLWGQWVKDHPKLANYKRLYWKQYKRNGIINITNWWCKQVIWEKDRNNKNEWKPERTYTELKELVDATRKRLIEKRKKHGRAYNIDFNLYN